MSRRTFLILSPHVHAGPTLPAFLLVVIGLTLPITALACNLPPIPGGPEKSLGKGLDTIYRIRI
jgi:hypothetical protein